MLIVACGLAGEAKRIERDGIRAIAGGGDPARLEHELDALATRIPGAILSSGLAGALDPGLRPGDVVIGGDAGFVARLRAVLPRAIPGRIVGQDGIAATVADKQALHRATGALAVDMESHVAERVARRHRLPFAVIRVISDGANETLPPAALVGMRPDGGVALGAVLASLARKPAQLPALIRTGRQAGRALAVLGGLYDMLGGAGIGRLDLREFALDMG